MVFSSIEFLLFFLPIFLFFYAVTPRRYRNLTLVAGSLIFYAFGELRYLALLVALVTVNFIIGLFLGLNTPNQGKHENNKAASGGPRHRLLLGVAVAGNIGILIGFKLWAGEDGLPLGISFYTFQMVSYLVDVSRRQVRRETSFFRFAAYVTMFPQLVSGPIVIYGEVRQQLRQRDWSMENLQEGLKIFTMGLGYKVLLADRIGLLWHDIQVIGFENISTPMAWLGAVAYSLRLYFDFYGYSLMAVGLGRMLGFSLPYNFNVPYMAVSVRDFYRRWHMTLGRWFQRYIYIPLGGSRKGKLRTVCNLAVVWLVTSLWHGGTANYLIWGMLLCLCIIVERQLEEKGVTALFRKGVLRVIPHLALWIVIPVSWVCFAIPDLPQLQVYLSRMFHVTAGIRVNGMDWKNAIGTYWQLLGIGFLACTPLVRRLYGRWKDSLPGLVVLAVLFWTCVWRLQMEGQNPFMYFSY